MQNYLLVFLLCIHIFPNLEKGEGGGERERREGRIDYQNAFGSGSKRGRFTGTRNMFLILKRIKKIQTIAHNITVWNSGLLYWREAGGVAVMCRSRVYHRKPRTPRTPNNLKTLDVFISNVDRQKTIITALRFNNDT